MVPSAPSSPVANSTNTDPINYPNNKNISVGDRVKVVYNSGNGNEPQLINATIVEDKGISYVIRADTLEQKEVTRRNILNPGLALEESIKKFYIKKDIEDKTLKIYDEVYNKVYNEIKKKCAVEDNDCRASANRYAREKASAAATNVRFTAYKNAGLIGGRYMRKSRQHQSRRQRKSNQRKSRKHQKRCKTRR